MEYDFNGSAVKQIIASRKQEKEARKVEIWTPECGVSKHTIYSWKSKYGGIDVSDAQYVKQLCEENARLKKLVADLKLDKDMIRKKRERKCSD